MAVYVDRSKQSDLYKAAVEALTRLNEAEGLNIAERAAAAALSDPRAAAFVERHGVKRSDRPPCLKRVAGGRHGGMLDHYEPGYRWCRAPRSDHASLWLKDGVAYAYRSEPYYLDTKAIGETYAAAMELGLDVTISARSSYFPGQSIEVLYTKKS